MPVIQDNSLHLVDLQASFDISGENQALLAVSFYEHQKRWPNRSLNLLGAEEVDGKTVFSHLQTSLTSSEVGARIHWELTFTKDEDTSRITRRQKRGLENKTLAIQKALAAIYEFSIQCDVHCTLVWQFSIESVSPIVQLPLMKLNIPGTPFGQISGVRFSHLGEDSHQYVVLDVTHGNELHLVSHFVFPGILSYDIPKKAVEMGSHLKDAFVRQAEASEGEA